MQKQKINGQRFNRIRKNVAKFGHQSLEDYDIKPVYEHHIKVL
jgi:hypothetical protein